MGYKILLSFLGGLGLFIYGMKMMGDGLEKTAGSKLKRLLEVLTNNRFTGVLVGTIVTCVIQSSSATTVMVVGFVNAGLMTLFQATGVIMGANIGTTITAQLIAFKLTSIAPVAIFIGVMLVFFAKRDFLKKAGEILAGFGILFLGMSLMSQAMYPLRDNQIFKDMMMHISNPIYGILIGAVITAILQSSSASIAIVQALAITGAIPLEIAIYILFGQNIGTCITAMLSSIGTNTTAKRAAVIHLLFNMIGTIMFLFIILLGLPYVDIVKAISPDSTVRQIANAHTLFNIINTLVMFPLAGFLVYLAKKIIKPKDDDDSEIKLKYLDERILETPTIAASFAIKEVLRMAKIARENVLLSVQSFLHKDRKQIEKVMETEKLINFLNHGITHYLVQINGLEIPEEDRNILSSMYHVVNDIERIGDHAENITEYAEYTIKNNLKYSKVAIKELENLQLKILDIIDSSIDVLMKREEELVDIVKDKENNIDELTDILRERHIQRLKEHQCDPAAGVIFIDLVTNTERIADHATNIAYSVLDCFN